MTNNYIHIRKILPFKPYSIYGTVVGAGQPLSRTWEDFFFAGRPVQIQFTFFRFMIPNYIYLGKYHGDECADDHNHRDDDCTEKFSMNFNSVIIYGLSQRLCTFISMQADYRG